MDEKWIITYENDTGYNDESFWEWWEISIQDACFKTENKEHAEWLCSLLNGEENK